MRQLQQAQASDQYIAAAQLSLPRRGRVTGEAGRVGSMANETARALRKTMTAQEVKLWTHLRAWRQRGFHFRRQAPRGQGKFIVDFV